LVCSISSSRYVQLEDSDTTVLSYAALSNLKMSVPTILMVSRCQVSRFQSPPHMSFFFMCVIKIVHEYTRIQRNCFLQVLCFHIFIFWPVDYIVFHLFKRVSVSILKSVSVCLYKCCERFGFVAVFSSMIFRQNGVLAHQYSVV